MQCPFFQMLNDKYVYVEECVCICFLLAQLQTWVNNFASSFTALLSLTDFIGRCLSSFMEHLVYRSYILLYAFSNRDHQFSMLFMLCTHTLFKTITNELRGLTLVSHFWLLKIGHKVRLCDCFSSLLTTRKKEIWRENKS